MTNENEQFDISFFYEKNIRAFLSRFYHGIVQSGENAKEFLEVELDNFYPKRLAGDGDTKSSMKDVFNKLDYVRVFLKNDELFESQILEPIKIASDLRLSFTKLDGGKRSANIQGLIFARSRNNDKNYGNSTTLSLVCPEIQSVMSMRISNKHAPENNGWVEFEKVQPIVLVNRLHPTPGSKTVINLIKKEKNLEEFSFIFSSITDLQFFSKSIEMENFSEMSSVQSDKQRHLGFTFVASGKITDYDGADITIQSCLNNKSLELTVASRNFRNNASVHLDDEMVGKAVVFLGTIWYQNRGKNDISIEQHELLDIQLCSDDFSAIILEVIGYVRQRRRCNAYVLKKEMEIDDDLFEKISEHLKSSPEIQLVEENGIVDLVFKTNVPSDKVKSAYVKSLNSIRRLRESARSKNAIQVVQDDVVDKNKTNIEGMIRQLCYDCRAHGKIGCKIRIKMIKKIAIHEESSEEGMNINALLEMFTDSNHDVETVRGQMWFLKNIVEFVDKKNKNVFLTKEGKLILSKIREKESEKFLSNLDLVDMMSIPDHIHIPTLLKILNNHKFKFMPLNKWEVMTKVFWSKINWDETEIKSKIENYENICNKICSIMMGIRYPMNVEKISELLALEGKTVKKIPLEMILDDLIFSGRLTNEEETFYEYSWDARIYDFFRNNPKQKLTVSEIIPAIGVAKLDPNSKQDTATEIWKILLGFEREGVLIKDHSKSEFTYWMWAEEYLKDPANQITEDVELKNTIQSEIRLTMKQNNTMSRNELEETIFEMICKLEFNISEDEQRNMIRDTVSEMIAKFEMYSDGFTLKYSDGTRK
jgi:hypothetical protein